MAPLLKGPKFAPEAGAVPIGPKGTVRFLKQSKTEQIKQQLKKMKEMIVLTYEVNKKAVKSDLLPANRLYSYMRANE